MSEERRHLGLEANPTDAELESIAQTWSEHCKHKIFSGIIAYTDNSEEECFRQDRQDTQDSLDALAPVHPVGSQVHKEKTSRKDAKTQRGEEEFFRQDRQDTQDRTEIIDSIFDTYIKKGTEEIGETVDWLVSVFHDNAGIIKFDDEWNLVFKVETHNSPSALDPYGGALTGIVGVNRDPAGTGLGAKLIFNTDVFCFAPPDYDKELPPRLLHPKRVFDGVRRGVEHGGNKSGIPTVNGAIIFDERYAGKPLVFCGTGGIIPRKVCGV
ncbi:hypothetical protein HQ563_13150, partial [bacterium]|nr:hypothetical protein [bacterium]